MSDAFDLQRFVSAQAPVYDDVLAELRAGRKRTHWMWFVFPQIAGLGHSPTAKHFALSSLAEARAYLDHPVLGDRLTRCTEAVLACGRTDAHAIFGSPDDLKFRSCLTLFSKVAGPHPIFAQALQAFFGGEEDRATLDRL